MAEVQSPVAAVGPVSALLLDLSGPRARSSPHSTYLLERSWETIITRGLRSERRCLRILGVGQGWDLTGVLSAAVSSHTLNLPKVGIWILLEVQI